MDRYDFLIVGAGFSGLVLAERLTSMGKSCLVVDRRDHIGGNAHDAEDAAGVLIHRYGPHYFRTNSDRVREYLSRFTTWHPVEYRVRSYSDGQYWSFPINLATYEQLVGHEATEDEFRAYLEEKRVPIEKPRNSEEVIVSQVGWELYEKFFLGYTLKQWKRHPRELDTSVCGRIPIRTNRDDRYLRESFQALPREGYWKLFENLVEASPGLEIRLETAFEEVRDRIAYRHLIYTGPVDAFFGFRYGRLPYRSLRFEPESFRPEALRDRLSISGKAGFWQPEMQVNYPNEQPFTRIVEIKHATGQRCPNTTILREYPQDFEGDAEPYYPIPNEETKALYARYAALAATERNVSFVGRLATYRYYNMDQVVAMALAEFDRLRARPS
ncbi:MAG: UDP-galactopyranose mutase [Acidobacteriota bacterium]|jgi:UDP-galactopyranose mutase